ncbi:MAG: hypothetical protein LBM19_02005 [Holosporales bacterium]|jgi:hypothetical protein|nr:hypothetical protein [Holosporales bacterium]
MKKLFAAIILMQFPVLASDVFKVEDINVRCNCDKDDERQRTETLGVDWMQRTNMPHPDIMDIVIIESQNKTTA